MSVRLFTRTDLERAARLALRRWTTNGGEPESAVAWAAGEVAAVAEPVFTRDDVLFVAQLAAQLAHQDKDMELPDFEGIAQQAVRAVAPA